MPICNLFAWVHSRESAMMKVAFLTGVNRSILVVRDLLHWVNQLAEEDDSCV